MPRNGISFEKVAGICAGLQAEGRKISVRAIHAESGGSMSTILEHYRRWQEQQTVLQKEEKLSDQFKVALLSEIKRQVDAARAVMIKQLKEAEDRAREGEELLGQAEDRVEELRGAIREGERAKSELEKQLEASKEKVAACEKRSAHIERTCEELRKAHIESEKRIAVAEARAEDRAKQINQLHNQIKVIKDEQVKTNKEMVETEKRAAIAESKLLDRKKRLSEKKK